MTKPIIIFGNKDLAEMAKWYWGSTVVGFTMDNPESDTFLGFPMYDFETITETRPSSEYDMFIPVIDNRTRAKIYNKAKNLGSFNVSSIDCIISLHALWIEGRI